MTTRHDWWTPWRNPRWVFIAVWMVFLIYPIVSVTTADRGATAKGVGFGLIFLFGVIYLLTAVYLLTGVEGHDWRGVWVFGVLVGLTAAMLPIIGEDAFGMAPFLMAVAAFTLPTQWTAAVIAALVIGSLTVPRLINGDSDMSLVIMLAVSGVTMLCMRVVSVREGERDRAEQRQRELNAQLAVVNERERVARDVHDILGHSLTVITIKSELATRLVDLDPQRATTEMAEVNQLARSALAEVRGTVGQLRSPDLPSTVAAAESALRAGGIDAVLPDPHTESDHGQLFAWVLREAVTNVVRHSGATRCVVKVDDTSISIHDNGSGMSTTVYGNGLRGLCERVESAGGILQVHSDSSGTIVTAEMA